MIRVLAVLIMTVALVGCKKSETTPNEVSFERGFELHADADFDAPEVTPTKSSIQGTWERTGIQWVAGIQGAPNFLVGPYKIAEQLPYVERWTFEGTSFKVAMYNEAALSYVVFRTGVILPSNNGNVFYVGTRVPDTQFLQSKFVKVSVNPDELKMRVKTQQSNNLRARTWLKKVN